jgi:hypothetical protein
MIVICQLYLLHIAIDKYKLKQATYIFKCRRTKTALQSQTLKKKAAKRTSKTSCTPPIVETILTFYFFSEVLEGHRKQCEAEGKYVGK